MAARIASASCGASMTTHSASSPSSQTLLSTSQVPPSRENVPEVTRWFTVSISLILASCLWRIGNRHRQAAPA